MDILIAILFIICIFMQIYNAFLIELFLIRKARKAFSQVFNYAWGELTANQMKMQEVENQTQEMFERLMK